MYAFSYMYLLYTDLDTARESKPKKKNQNKIETKIEIEYWIWQIKIEKNWNIFTRQVYIYILEFIKLVTSCDEGIRTHQQLYGELLSQ